MNYKLIKSTQNDYDFLKNVHHVTLKDHITKIYGWDETKQDHFFNEDFKTGKIQIIQFDNKNAGLLMLNATNNDLYIVHILILPEFQNLGIGSKIIKDLISSSKTEGSNLKLGVFKINTKAKKLYELLGFKVSGETDTHFLMQI